MRTERSRSSLSGAEVKPINSKTMNNQRRYDIDWLRVIAIGLLLIYHIAIIFQPWAMFIGFMRSEEFAESIWTLMTMLNVWRIPFLFFVSGMGVYFAMKKRNWKALLQERAKRILLPFVFGFLAITPLHLYIFQDYYNLPLNYMPSAGHLWFLGNIFCYVLLLFPLFYLLKKYESGKFQKALSKLMSYAFGPLCISVFFIIEVALVKPQIFELYAETWHGFFIGLTAFFFGFLFVYAGQSFWKTMSKWKWIYLAIASVLYILRFTEFESISNMYLTSIESNCWIFAMFGLGYSYLNKPSVVLKYLSQAAYPVYIIHMAVLFGVAYFILPFDWNPIVQFMLTTLVTFIVCFVIYEFIIRRIKFLHPFLGLKWNFKTSVKNVKRPLTTKIPDQ